MAVCRPYLSMYARERICNLAKDGLGTTEILLRLRKENIPTCRQTVWRLQRHIAIIKPLPKSGHPKKLTPAILEQIDNKMNTDDETTATELQKVIENKFGASLSPRTLLRGRRSLGWTKRGTAYCQMIREANKAKRLEWARQNLGSSFEDVIWTDETSVQLESHRRFHCYKKGLKPRYKPRPKHPVKVHVWAGISIRGATGVCIFDGIMDAPMYTRILDGYLVPFIRDVYPLGHRLMQDNDPKHTSRHAKEFFAQKSINWWPTPAESPDANPIENLWHELKVYCSSMYICIFLNSESDTIYISFSQEYIRREIKPKSKDDLVNGILQFWSTVTPSKCQKYISHLRKVIPEMIRTEGGPTGY